MGLGNQCSLEELNIVSQLRHVGDVVVAAAAGAAALQGDLELAESRVDVVVLLVELVRLGNVGLEPNLELE